MIIHRICIKVITVAKKFYITTAIPYVNADPHIGHALEFIQADAIYRYNKLAGFDTFLTTGADENSIKNVQAAEEKGITPQKLCDINADKFRQMARLVHLSFDSFLRSSSKKDHWSGVHRLWELCRHDIYKKKYRGLYCIGCEAFYAEGELLDGRCPEHETKPELVEEENYFFRLSKYQKQLEKLIQSNKLRIIPESRKNEVLSFIRSGLEDFSVSRSVKRAKGWGVPVPNDDLQIQYVWFDALGIYLTGIGYGTDEKKFKKLWPADVHVIGKGITRFHAVYWPAILLSAGLPLPKAIFVHGYVTVEGQKMSKSLGNVVNPVDVIKKYGADRLRYFMLRLPPFEDGDFSESTLVERANNEIVANFSNLFYRITSFIEKNFDGKVPNGKIDKGLSSLFLKKSKIYAKATDDFRLNDALATAMDLASDLNRYFQHKKPWEAPPKANDTLYTSVNLLKDICTLLYPFIPESIENAFDALGTKPSLKNIGKEILKPGKKIKSSMLFKKIEMEKIDISKMKKTEIKESDTINIVNGMLSMKEFQKLDLRIGRVIAVEDHPNADKMYVIKVDLGKEQRQLVIGLKGIYSKEALQGKQVIVICNLEPKELRGVASEGMLLAADDGTLLLPEKEVANGVKVR